MGKRGSAEQFCEGDILDPVEHLSAAARYVLEHHERWDGSGYPFGLESPATSEGGQIVGIAEAWSAFQEERPHRSAMSRRDAFDALAAHRDQWFPTRLVEALRKVEDF